MNDNKFLETIGFKKCVECGCENFVHVYGDLMCYDCGLNHYKEALKRSRKTSRFSK